MSIKDVRKQGFDDAMAYVKEHSDEYADWKIEAETARKQEASAFNTEDKVYWSCYASYIENFLQTKTALVSTIPKINSRHHRPEEDTQPVHNAQRAAGVVGQVFAPPPFPEERKRQASVQERVLNAQVWLSSVPADFWKPALFAFAGLQIGWWLNLGVSATLILCGVGARIGAALAGLPLGWQYGLGLGFPAILLLGDRLAFAFAVIIHLAVWNAIPFVPKTVFRPGVGEEMKDEKNDLPDEI